MYQYTDRSPAARVMEWDGRTAGKNGQVEDLSDRSRLRDVTIEPIDVYESKKMFAVGESTYNRYPRRRSDRGKTLYLTILPGGPTVPFHDPRGWRAIGVLIHFR